MSKYSNTIEYKLSTTLDRSGVDALLRDIAKVRTELNKIFMDPGLSSSFFKQSAKELEQLSQAVSKSFNSSLGMLDSKKLTTELNKANISLSKMQSDFYRLGTVGTTSLNNIITRLGKLDTGLKQTSNLADKVFNTFGNTVRWGITASIFQNTTNSIREALNYVKELDTSLTNIRIVSDYTNEEMKEFAKYANEAAKALGSTTVAYTDASLIFAQQGYSLEDSKQLADLTIKVANTTQQSTSEVSEQITAWTNGYQMSLEQLNATLDKVTKVAAVSASDTEELMTAASKVASVANTLGVTEDQLISQMSTIISVTREAPESVGNSLKTIYSRLADLKMGDTLEDGVDLGTFSKQVENVGVQVLDANGELRSMGDIIEDLMDKWQELDTAQQQALGVTLAGRYQYNRFVTLMNNMDMYNEMLDESADSVGFLEETQGKYMESTEAKLNQMQAAAEQVVTTLVNGDSFDPWIEGATTVLGLVNNIADAFGGIQGMSMAALPLLGKTFSNQIASSFSNMYSNRQLKKIQGENLKNANANLVAQYGLNNKTDSMDYDTYSNPLTQNLVNFNTAVTKNSGIMNAKEIERCNQLIDEQGKLTNAVQKSQDGILQILISTEGYLNSIVGSTEKEAEKSEVVLSLRKMINEIRHGKEISADALSNFKTGLQNEMGTDLTGALNPDLEGQEDYIKNIKSSAAVAQDAVDGLETSIKKALNELKKNGATSKQTLNQLKVAFEDVEIAAELFEENIKDDGIAATELKESMSSLSIVLDAIKLNNIDIIDAKDVTMVERLESALREAQESTRVCSEAQESLGKQFIINKENLEGFLNAIAQYCIELANLKHSSNQGDTFVESMNMKSMISNINELVMGFGQLAFSVQSFKELGRIFEDEDLTTSEKMIEIVANLGFTVPMVISGIVSMAEAVKELRKMDLKLIATKKLLTIAIGEESAAQTVEAIRAGETTAALALEKAGVYSLTDAFRKLWAAMISNPYILTAAAGITAFSVAIAALGAEEEKEKERQEKLASRLEETSNLFSTVDEKMSTFRDLYNIYKDTGEASDDLREVAEELADALERQNDKVLIATDSWEAFKKSIDAATLSQKKSMQYDLEEQYIDLVSGTPYSGGKTATTGLSKDLLEFMGVSYEENIISSTDRLGSGNRIYQSTSILADTYQILALIDDSYEKAKEKVVDLRDELNSITDETEYNKKQAEIDMYQGYVDKLGSIKETTDPINENIDKRVMNAVSMAEAEGKFEGLDEMSLKMAIADIPEVKIRLQGLSKNHAKYDEFVNNIIAQLDTAETEVIEKAQQELSSSIVTDQIIKEHTDEDGKVDDVVLEFVNKIKNLSIPEESKLDIFEMFDFNAIDLEAELERCLNEVDLKDSIDTEDIIDTDSIREDISNIRSLVNGESVEDYTTGDIISPIFDERTVNALKEASNQSESFADVMGLLYDNTLNENMALLNIKTTMDSMDHQEAFSEIINGLEDMQSNLDISNLTDDEIIDWAEEITIGLNNASQSSQRITADLKEVGDTGSKALNEIKKEGLNFSRAMDQVEESIINARKEIDEFEDSAFNLSIDIAGDLVDQSEDICKAINSIVDASSGIGEGFQVAADDVVELAQAFPGILEGYSVTTDGMIQLNQGVVESILGLNATDAQSFAEAQASKLEAFSVYAQTMAEVYGQQAQLFAELAENEKITQEEVETAHAESELRIAQAQAESCQDQNLTAQETAQLESQYSGEAGTDIATNITSGASNASAGLGELAQSGVTSINSIIEAAHQAAQAISGIDDGEELGNTVTANTGAVVSVRGADTTNSVSSGTVSMHGNGSISGGSSSGISTPTLTTPSIDTSPSSDMSGVDLAKSYSQEYSAKSDLYEKLGALTSAEAAKLKATAASAANNIGNVGQGSGSGGGSGGGSGSSYEPKTKDSIEEEVDLYEKVNVLLKSIESDYDKINKQRERMTGIDVVDKMKEEMQLLYKQIELQEKKLSIEREEAAQLANTLSSKYGVTFEGEGDNKFISNYAETLLSLEGDVNSLIAKYNSTTTEEGQQALEDSIENAKEKLESFKDDYKRYDELVSDEIKGTINDIEDLKDSIEDIGVEAVNTSIKAINSLKDIQDKWLEFNFTLQKGLEGDENPFARLELDLKKISTSFDSALIDANEFYDNLIKRAKENKEAATTNEGKLAQQKLIDKYINAKNQAGKETIEDGGLGEIDMAYTAMGDMLAQYNEWKSTGTSTLFGEDSADLFDSMKSAYDAATDAIENLKSNVKELHEDILDAIEEENEAIQERQDQYSDITEELEHQLNILTMIHGEKKYDEMNKIIDAQTNSYIAQAEELTQQVAIWEDLLGKLTEGSDEYKKVLEYITEGQKQINELVESALTGIKTKYENTVNSIVDSFIGSAFGGQIDIDWISKQWELINRNEDNHLDAFNKDYNIQKLQLKYQDLLNDSQDMGLGIQQRISEQMAEQLDYLREKENLSSYDVAYAQAKLEILQKQIALEAAQSNKNQLKLRRDAQGNYSYAYAASDEDTNQASQDLLDAQANAYNISKDQMVQVQADSLSALTEAASNLRDIWNNAELTLEEKKERTEFIMENLRAFLEENAIQLSDSQQNMITEYMEMWEILSEENKADMEQVANDILENNLSTFDQIDDRWATSITSWLDNLKNFMEDEDNGLNATEDKLEDALNKYQEEVDKVAEAVGDDFGSMIDGSVDFSNKILEAAEAVDRLKSSQEKFNATLKLGNDDLATYEKELEKYKEKISDLENAQSDYAKRTEELARALAVKEAENSQLSGELNAAKVELKAVQEKKTTSSTGSSSNSSSTSGFAGTGYGKGQLIEGIAGNIWTYGTWGDDPYRLSNLKNKFGNSNGQTIYDGVQSLFMGNPAYGYQKSPDKWASDGYGYYKKFGIDYFDTGGYTGTWGDTEGNQIAKNGKLAYLHQKELILNETDTLNILKAVASVRQMTTELKNGAFDSVVSRLNESSTLNKLIGEDKDSVMQEIHITAEFPNASSVDEIKTALLSLNDLAIQKIYKTR